MLKKNKNLSYSVCKEAGEGQNEHEASLAQQCTEDLPIYVVFCPSVLQFFLSIVESAQRRINRLIVRLTTSKTCGLCKPHCQCDFRDSLVFCCFSGGRTLQILNAQEDDAGRYACVATNEAGEMIKHYEVKVYSKF